MANAISSWSFPKSLIVGGKEYGINSDYRAVISVFTALNDYELKKGFNPNIIEGINRLSDLSKIENEYIDTLLFLNYHRQKKS